MKLTEQQWRERLSDEEYRVCREKGTERPFSGDLLHENADGMYVCKCCGSELFSSDTKFDAGCGWPSFFAEYADNVAYHTDTSHGMIRTEITCKHCGCHLGHVFDDGPEPTGQRFCVNSVSVSFKQKNS
ncbi:peptide-methionine (R)-S-oxide reductase MsrB [Neptunicella marina]|uniref:Peptide methionine sulfoxide reductase MsrB n=1 Tax=Neptunicella marina TaxID=2125989 RepID=A0A8J6M3A2_9ALTE|nr:peptide-methionine (R)-S-oxide reductase MsrB [Neptunicella marina]MBC3767288.1 peptide-methionine (R)-S-oxide reductase MsrB [Neptunicella marina]